MALLRTIRVFLIIIVAASLAGAVAKEGQSLREISPLACQRVLTAPYLVPPASLTPAFADGDSLYELVSVAFSSIWCWKGKQFRGCQVSSYRVPLSWRANAPSTAPPLTISPGTFDYSNDASQSDRV